MANILQTFWFIFSTVILPIFLQICVGYFIQKKFKFDLRTLSQVQFYVFVPSLLFIKIYQGDLQGDLAIKILTSTVLIYVIMAALGFLTGKAMGFNRGARNAFANTVSIYNSGNYCIPMMQLLYNNDPFAMAVQAVIMTTQNIVVSTFGAFIASSGKSDIKTSLKGLLRIPMIYVAALAVFFKMFDIHLWAPLVDTVDIMSSCLVPIALFTLGAQLAQTKGSFKNPKIYISNFLKLIAAPAVGFGVVSILGITGIAAQVVLIVSAAPTAVNVLLLAMQYDNEVDFTGQSVFSATVLSTVTVTMVIYIAQILFNT